jgi:sugar/nucleoside kinase (ribokinase family)
LVVSLKMISVKLKERLHVKERLHLVFYLIMFINCNPFREPARDGTNVQDARLSAGALIRRIPIVVLTMDAEGSMLFTKGKHDAIPIIPVTLADPTGAGDAYRAGFLTAFSRGYAPLTCARVGTTTASFTVEKVGCQTNLPTWEAMEGRYTHTFGPLEKGENP